MQEQEYELVVSQGKIPFLRRVGAAFYLTLVCYGVYMICLRLYQYEITEDLIASCGGFMETIGYSLPVAIGLALKKTVLIDIDKNKLVSRYSVGPFSRDYLRPVPELEYVSVFRDSKEFFQVNLWYKGNKHYKMYCFEEPKPAFAFASMVAEKLNLEVFDATVKGDFKWIGKTIADSE